MFFYLTLFNYKSGLSTFHRPLWSLLIWLVIFIFLFSSSTSFFLLLCCIFWFARWWLYTKHMITTVISYAFETHPIYKQNIFFWKTPVFFVITTSLQISCLLKLFVGHFGLFDTRDIIHNFINYSNKIIPSFHLPKIEGWPAIGTLTSSKV